MLFYGLKRFFLAILVTITVSFAAFLMVHASGNVAIAMAGQSATSADIERISEEYNLNRPLVVQYGAWVKQILSGELGQSFYYKKPVTELLAKRMPVTLTLGVCALLFALALAIPLGVLAALWPNSWIDRVALTVAVFGQAMPSFWFALFLIYLFGVQLAVLPISGVEHWFGYILPAVALGYYATPSFMRVTRTGMLEVLSSDFVRLARAKGLRQNKVLFKHALRNAIIPVVSMSAVELGFMLGGSVIIETVFAVNGMGYLAYQSIRRADFPVVQAIILLLCLFYVVLTFVADMLNAYLDPRIRVN